MPVPSRAAPTPSSEAKDDAGVGVDDPCTSVGWCISGFASKAIMSILFTIAPIMLTASARGYAMPVRAERTSALASLLDGHVELRSDGWELSGLSGWLGGGGDPRLQA